MNNNYKKIGFIGFGLIGGAVARSLKNIYKDLNITAYNYRTSENPNLTLAKNDNIIDVITSSIEEVSKSDVIFLCAPVQKNLMYLKEIAPLINEDTMITDVGSVKGDIFTLALELGLEKNFLGGHPMTGKEKAGYAYSSANMLKDHIYVMTPSKETLPSHIEWLNDFIVKSEGTAVTLDPYEHDAIAAGISHAPHVISANLVNTVAGFDTNGNYELLAAGGFKDITRISSSSPEMWRDICITNKAAILKFIDVYEENISKIKKYIENEDQDEIYKFFESAKIYRDSIIKKED